MIRKAIVKETKKNLKIIINLLYDIFKDSKNQLFIKNEEKTIKTILKEIFLLPNNFFSYENFIVNEINNTVVGIATIYLHEEIEQLKINTLNLLKQKIRNIKLEDLEMHELSKNNELYLDVLAVSKEMRGKGAGTALIDFIIKNKLKSNKSEFLSLNVHYQNAEALKLYLRLNFKIVDNIIINGQKYHHMQKKFYK